MRVNNKSKASYFSTLRIRNRLTWFVRSNRISHNKRYLWWVKPMIEIYTINWINSQAGRKYRPNQSVWQRLQDKNT